ncbi:CRISPR-associated helicase Cas3' [Sporolactobacillus sp. THM19-2]|uniref:CRISPR-associated helicase Cas3' n=1 Tax=Sporolactobacillus sp. THM19-2 TaxID=2511171 RepID=UPI00102176AB|nr:CRISPR-associated helicase Cas3' [Sporolactobacillus sp. THM19-2]RYL93714.1 CRISPR-associated helicase Cas3' [Sporolactobacillus sp. THM19-2]
MKNRFLAKSKPEQTIAEHTEDLLREYRKLKTIYPNIPNLDWKLLKMACFFHDFGKLNTKFQNKIMQAINTQCELLPDHLQSVQEIPHGYLSCAFIPLKELPDDDSRRILAQAVYYHHIRHKVEFTDLKKTIKEDLTQYYSDFAESLRKLIERDGFDSYTITPPKIFFWKFVKKRLKMDNRPEATKRYIMVKGLLNKIDHAASASIEVEVPGSNLMAYLEDYYKRDLHSSRNQMQNYMMAHQNDNNVIIASTGIGKTEGALFWIGNSKGFFTLPLRVSINAIYKRIHHTSDQNGKGIGYKAVGLLHSDTEVEYVKSDLYSKDYYEQTKQWSMPLTVCTLDQILDFVFKQEGYEQKLAILAYSKLVIDEIQMYSAKMLACLLIALKEVTRMGGRFMIMTATFAPFVEDFIKKLSIPFNKNAHPFLKQVNGKSVLRHRVQIMDDQVRAEDILKNKNDDKILVIVNTVNKAQSIYKALKNAGEEARNRREVFLFHSRFTKADRSIKEDDILRMGRLDNESRCIWVTTQVVEASVDIDFDVLYTELSDLGGLFQRMGRVFRNRELTDSHINVIVYTGGKTAPSGISAGSHSVIDKGIFDLSKQALQALSTESNPVLFSEEKKMHLIAKVYTTERLRQTSYYSDLRNYLHLLKNIVEYDNGLDKNIQNLRDIFNQPVIPYQVFLREQEKINKLRYKYDETLNHKVSEEELKKAKEQRILVRDKIRSFTIDIPKYRYLQAIHNNRHVNEEDVHLGDYLVFPVVDYPYTSEIGMEFNNELGKFRSQEQFI